MSKKKKILAENIVWDLSDLYSGIDDPKIAKDLVSVEGLIKAFTGKYKGNINSPKLTPKFLLKAIKEQEDLIYVASRVSLFASLLYSKNVTSEKIGAFYQKISEFVTKIDADLAWFSVEWLHLNDKIANKIIGDSLFDDYRHFLIQSRAMKPHTLSEKEEVLLKKTALSGASAFERLFNIVNTDTKYKLIVDGEEKELNFSELAPYLTEHKDRNVRKDAAKALTEGLLPKAKVYAFTMNTLLLDSKVGDELRGFDYPQHATLLADELSPEIVNSMSAAIEGNHETVERYYKLKKKVLGLDKLHEWDRYSKIYPEVSQEVTWKETVGIVLDSFTKFDADFSSMAKKFLDNGWVDAPVSDSKRSGAFCAYAHPKIHPYVLMNFKGKLEDSMTLAHELGHGIHFYSGSKLPLSEYAVSTPVAEIASVFSEALVFDDLYEKATDKKVKINLLADRIQGSFATVFVQNAFYLFESDIHEHRREKGELSLEDFNGYYNKRLQAMFGNGLTLTKDHAHWWMGVPHFYNYDFYVYSYCFGELLTFALYALYKEDSKFVNNYMECLKLGGSLSPVDLTKKMGVDITKKEFWEDGLKILDGYVEEFEQLTKC
jgi:oligoendopeptidase F